MPEGDLRRYERDSGKTGPLGSSESVDLPDRSLLANLRAELDRLRHDHQELRKQIHSKAGSPTSGDERRESEAERKHDLKAKEQKEDEKSASGDEGESDEHEEPENKDKRNVVQRGHDWVRSRPLAAAGLLVLLIVGLIGGVFLWRYFQSYESTDDAEIDAHIDDVTSRINGTVIAVHVEDNQRVTQGQTLIVLDPRDYEVAKRQAQSDLTQSRAQLEAQNPSVPITETTNASTVSTAQSDVNSAQAAVDEARRKYESAVADMRQAQASNLRAQAEEARYRQLVEKDETSKEVYGQHLEEARAGSALLDSRRAAVEAAAKVVTQRQAALTQARIRLAEQQKNSPRQLNIQHAMVQQRQAGVDTAQAKLDQALLNLTYCNILSPVEGIAGERNVEVGEHVTAGQQLLSITETGDLWVTANFKETQLQHMHPGQHVTVHVDTLDKDFYGYVESMPGATGSKYSLLPPENATGNFVKVVQRLPVRIRLNKGQDGLDLLRPGMSVEPKVWLK